MTYFDPVAAGPHNIGGLGITYRPVPIRPVNDGDELFRFESEPKGEIKYRFEVSLHEPPLAECEPVVAFLNYLTGGVRETINRFEAAGHLPARR